MTAAKFKLDNLTCIIDRNVIQIDGGTERRDAARALGRQVPRLQLGGVRVRRQRHRRVRRDGRACKQVTGKPQVIIAHTVLGKGVSYMEGDYLWHGKPPKPDEAEIALRELRAERASSSERPWLTRA